MRPLARNATADRATADLLTGGFDAGVSAFVLRHWRPGADLPEPAFVTWLLGAGRYCLTVRYGRFSLKGKEWRVDDGSGLQGVPSPLEQARVEAQLTGEMLQGRLNRRPDVAPALVLFDMDPDRRIERLAGAAVLRCSGTWRAAPGDWPMQRPEPGGGRRWRRYPR